MPSRKAGYLLLLVVYRFCDTSMGGRKLLPDSRLNSVSSGLKMGVTLRMISTQSGEGGSDAIEDLF